VAANRAVRARADGDPLADSRVSLRLGDARGGLMLANRRWDAIVSQPSHPWTAGASHLYTREFFALVRSRLSPTGVFVQWIGAAFVDSDRLRALLAAQVQVFAHVQVYRPEGGAIVMVASDAPFHVAETAALAIARSPRDFAVAGIHRVEDVIGALALDDDGTRAFAAGAVANTDDRNLFATSDRPSARNRDGRIEAEFARHDPFPAFADAVDLASLVRGVVAGGRPGRLRQLADHLDPARRELVLGWAALGAQRPRNARNHFMAALGATGTSASAEIGLALADDSADTARLPERARAVVEVRRRRGDTAFARARDEQLAQWQPGELLYPEAAEERVRWRLERGEPGDFDAALPIVDAALECSPQPRLLLYRAEIAARSGRSGLAWLSLHALGERGLQVAPDVAARGLALAHRLGAPPTLETVANLDRLVHRRRAAPARSQRIPLPTS